MAIYFAFLGKPWAITHQWIGSEKQCPIYRNMEKTVHGEKNKPCLIFLFETFLLVEGNNAIMEWEIKNTMKCILRDAENIWNDFHLSGFQTVMTTSTFWSKHFCVSQELISAGRHNLVVASFHSTLFPHSWHCSSYCMKPSRAASLGLDFLSRVLDRTCSAENCCFPGT